MIFSLLPVVYTEIEMNWNVLYSYYLQNLNNIVSNLFDGKYTGICYDIGKIQIDVNPLVLDNQMFDFLHASMLSLTTSVL